MMVVRVPLHLVLVHGLREGRLNADRRDREGCRPDS
jgi:hypothetical protein